MGSNQRILMVSSDHALLDEMGKPLVEARYDVRCALSAQEAIQVYESWPAELLIIDYQTSDIVPRPFLEALCRVRRNIRYIAIVPKGATIEALRSAQQTILAVLHHPCRTEDVLPYVHGFFQSGAISNNRRFHHRYLFPTETHCILINPFSDATSRPIVSLMRDVSRSGVSLLVRQLLPVPGMIKLLVHLTDQSRPVSMLAKSISCMLTQIPGVYRVGAKFVGLLPPEMEEAIAETRHDGQAGNGGDMGFGQPLHEAIVEWLKRHQNDEGLALAEHSISMLAEELARIDRPDGTVIAPPPVQDAGGGKGHYRNIPPINESV